MKPRLTVVGVGGAGCNAINNMIASGLEGVEFIVANTDAQALAASAATTHIQLGAQLTEGLGAGSRPEIGEAAAEEAVDEIRQKLAGAHMVFIAAGMGGGTGTGAASVIARISRELGILTVGVVTKPFLFEGARRMRIAEAGVEELKGHVDTLIVIPNQNLFRIASEHTTFSDAFIMADQVLYSGVACIVDLIIKEGLINLDFADVRTVMTGMGSAMMGTGEASGEGRATLAAEEAISNPLVDEVSLHGAKGLLLSITGGGDLTLFEVDEAASRVRQEIDPEANLIVGATYDHALDGKVRVSIVASGMTGVNGEVYSPPGSPDAWIEALHGPPSHMSAQVQDRDDRQAHTNDIPQTDQFDAYHTAASRQSRDQSYDHARGTSRETSYDPRETRTAAHHQDEDVRARLSDALKQNEADHDADLYHPQAQKPSPLTASHSQTWQGPGNVRIQESVPKLSGNQAPPPLPPPGEDAPHTSAQTFVPAPPHDVRRQRRMPDVSDFPPVGQRAYNAQQGPANESPEVYEQDRRPSFFERIASRVRGGSDSIPGQEHRGTHDASSTTETDAYGYEASEPEGQFREPRDGGQPPELPTIFSRRR